MRVAEIKYAEERRKTIALLLKLAAIPALVVAVVVFALSPSAGEPAFWQDGHLRGCFVGMNAFGLLVAPWVALGALVRQREAFAREQALAFDLERSELARQALDARMHLLQAQVAPHGQRQLTGLLGGLLP